MADIWDAIVNLLCSAVYIFAGWKLQRRIARVTNEQLGTYQMLDLVKPFSVLDSNSYVFSS